jgi:UTP--glucose-1-phosphate uridylyltransferase
MIVTKAIIPVAGLGTRMLPATKAIPKELVPVVRKPSVQWVVESVVEAGVTEIVFVTSGGKSAIEDHFDTAPLLEQALESKGKADLLDAVRAASRLARVVSVRQPVPLGLGHAVLMAREVVGDEPFAVVLPDELVAGAVPPLAQCLRAAGSAAGVIGLCRVPRSEVSRYGIVRAREHAPGTVIIEDMVEKPPIEAAPSDLAITGPYVLPPEVFDDLARVTPGSLGEIQLTDALRQLARRRTIAGRLIEGERLDTGHALGFIQANVVMGLADPAIGPALAAWLRQRVS